jgi:hypothetical protein
VVRLRFFCRLPKGNWLAEYKRERPPWTDLLLKGLISGGFDEELAPAKCELERYYHCSTPGVIGVQVKTAIGVRSRLDLIVFPKSNFGARNGPPSARVYNSPCHNRRRRVAPNEAALQEDAN